MTKLTNEELVAAVLGPDVEFQGDFARTHRAEILQRMAEGAAGEASPQGDYFWPEGGLKWTHPIDVGHLILQLQTLDPKMKVSSVAFIDMADGRKARAFGLSMSRERWNEAGWLNFTLPGPECLAIWASIRQEINGLAPIESGSASTAGPRPVTPHCPKCGIDNFHRAVQTVRCFGCLTDFDIEGVAVKEQVHRSSLLHRPNDPLPEGCYCKPGQCMAPVMMGRQMPCRDPEKAQGKTRCCDNGYLGEAHDCQKSNPEAAKS